MDLSCRMIVLLACGLLCLVQGKPSQQYDGNYQYSVGYDDDPSGESYNNDDDDYDDDDDYGVYDSNGYEADYGNYDSGNYGGRGYDSGNYGGGGGGGKHNKHGGSHSGGRYGGNGESMNGFGGGPMGDAMAGLMGGGMGGGMGGMGGGMGLGKIIEVMGNRGGVGGNGGLGGLGGIQDMLGGLFEKMLGSGTDLRNFSDEMRNTSGLAAPSDDQVKKLVQIYQILAVSKFVGIGEGMEDSKLCICP